MILKSPLRVLGMLNALGIAFSPLHAQSISNPLPDPVDDGGPGIRLAQWVRIPNSPLNGKAPRLNMMWEVPDGSGFMWVNDQRGYLYRVSKSGGAPTLYLNLETHFPSFDIIGSDAFQTGFSSFALHPEFAANGIFYTVVSVPQGTMVPDFPVESPVAPISHIDVVLRWTVDDPAAATFAGSHEVLMAIEQPYADHNVGEIAFNPTARPGDADYGLLYLAAFLLVPKGRVAAA